MEIQEKEVADGRRRREASNARNQQEASNARNQQEAKRTDHQFDPPDFYTPERMLEIGRGKGKGHNAIPVRSVFCDKFSAFFITEEKSRDKNLNKHLCYITKTASGATGVITTV